MSNELIYIGHLRQGIELSLPDFEALIEAVPAYDYGLCLDTARQDPTASRGLPDEEINYLAPPMNEQEWRQRRITLEDAKRIAEIIAGRPTRISALMNACDKIMGNPVPGCDPEDNLGIRHKEIMVLRDNGCLLPVVYECVLNALAVSKEAALSFVASIPHIGKVEAMNVIITPADKICDTKSSDLPVFTMKHRIADADKQQSNEQVRQTCEENRIALQWIEHLRKEGKSERDIALWLLNADNTNPQPKSKNSKGKNNLTVIACLLRQDAKSPLHARDQIENSIKSGG